MATSFPFLKIAREWRMQYGDVIRVAEFVWNGHDGLLPIENPMSEEAFYDISIAVDVEKERRCRP